MLLWNSNGLANHKDELDALIHDRRIDVVLVTETHFTDKSRFYIKDYTTYKTNHPNNTAQGGAAILVKSSLSHFPLPPFSSEFLQTSSISLKCDSQAGDIVISSSYWPPNKNISINQFNSFFQSHGPKFIAGGDFNAKHPQWGCRTSNPRGCRLLNVLNSNPYSLFSPPEPTYWPTSRRKLPDILDVFVSSTLNPSQVTVENLHELSSDHSPVLFTLHVSPVAQPPSISLVRGRVDWESFRNFLDNTLNLRTKLKTRDDLDEAVQLLTTTIQQAVWTSTTDTKHSRRTDTTLPTDIRRLISMKRRARQKWHRSRLPSDKVKWNRLTQQLKDRMKQYRHDEYDKLISGLTTKDKSIWNETKRILNYKPSLVPIKKTDNTWAKTDQEKAETFAHHLTQLFSIPDNNSEDITDELYTPLQLSLPPKAFSPSDVTYCIRNLKKRKAPGFDLITAEVLSHMSKKSIMFLTYIYNSILRLTYFPLPWRFSIVKMIPKPKKPSHLTSSYRPISLLPILSKIFEKLLLRRLYPILESMNLIPDHQFGFRADHSTVMQCHRVVDVVASTLEKSQCCPSAFLDMQQAFDTVWHNGLLLKLKKTLPFTYYLILKSYLSNRFSQVSYRSSYSTIFPIHCGVPQGSILGPVLFSIYTSDLPLNPSTVLCTFADDIAVLSPHANSETATSNLQSHLNSITEWTKRWKLKINAQKSQNICFTLRHCNFPSIFIDGAPLPTADVVRYLGLYIDKKLTWNPHTRLKKTELKHRFLLLYRLIGRNSKLSLEHKILLYKTILRPLWTYGLELWGSTKPSNSKRIQSMQSKILRAIANAPYYVSNLTLHTDLRIPYVCDLAKSRYLSFHNKLQSHPNSLVHPLASLSIPGNPPRRLKRRWPRDHLQ